MPTKGKFFGSRLPLYLLTCCLLPGLASAQRIVPVSDVSVERPLPAATYTISRDDLLDVVVFDVPELSRELRVSPSGTVMIPLIPDSLQASGLTLAEFRDNLSRELRDRGLVSDPRVSVTIKESRRHCVAIAGAVKNPQIYPLMTESRLLDVLSQAGGLAENAGSTINITRASAIGATPVAAGDETSTAAETVSVDLKQLLEGAHPALNLPVYPGDSITVPIAGVVYVVGAVNKPGGFPLNLSHEELTVLQALALAEDVKTTALRDQGMIVRRGAQYPNGRQEIPVKVSQILAGTQPDVRLQANDILFIPDSMGKRAFRRGAEAAIQIATGIAIWHH